MLSQVIRSPIVNPLDAGNWFRGGASYPSGAILYKDATKNKPLLPVTYNGKYLVVKNV